MQKRLDASTINKIYSGWLGKIVGVIHGANIEGWPAEQIARTFGEITDLPFVFRQFCADDDINGPVFFQRAVLDYGKTPDLEELAKTFLNYVSDGHGFFWWGGYGVSTEDTAYHNLVEGIPAGISGSARLNGPVMANQIGGQIFSDCWGWICPGNPREAALLADRMASLTHDQEGRNGARFVAAAVAAAFDAASCDEILEKALAQVPAESAYAAMVRDVFSYVTSHRADPKACFSYVKEKYDYPFYPGVCHIIPNAAVMVLALLCGNGDYARTIHIAAMCGWDTDCNEGNLGAIMGTFCGIEGIPEHYVEQVHDIVIASSALGFLNLQSVPQIAEQTIRAAVIQNDLEPDAFWKKVLEKPEGQDYHFAFPQSTHGIRTEGLEGYQHVMRNVEDSSCEGGRALLITNPGFENGKAFAIYKKTYFRPEDCDDNRYQPDLSPIVYPGNEVCVQYRYLQQDMGKTFRMEAFYVDRLTEKERVFLVKDVKVETLAWQFSTLCLPAEKNVLIEQVGVRLTGQNVAPREQRAPFSICIGRVEIRERPDYSIGTDHLFQEIWTAVDQNPAGFSSLRGIAEAAEGVLGLSASGKPAEMYTGSTNWKDYDLTAGLMPVFGEAHYVLARVQGGMRWYGAGFICENGIKYAAILKKDRDIRVLAKQAFAWEVDRKYRVQFSVRGNGLCASFSEWTQDDLQETKEALAVEFTDGEQPYLSGCVGFGNQGASRTTYTFYQVKTAHI